MSHFSQKKRKFVILTTSCPHRMGLTGNLVPEWWGYPVRPNAEITIEQDNGWRRRFLAGMATSTSWLLTSILKQPLSVDGFLRRVTQRYAYQTLWRKPLSKDFKLLSNNRIKTVHLAVSTALECVTEFVTPSQQTTERTELRARTSGIYEMHLNVLV